MYTLLDSAINSITPETIQRVVVFMVALLASIAVHEYGHARVADYLGDRLPRSQGRVTLNPTAHADPWGTVLFPLIGLLTGIGVLGWGRPVQISLHAARYRHGLGRRGAHFLIAAAGPFMNVLFALVLSLAMVVALHMGLPLAAKVLKIMVALNVGLAAFNLIPCPPLDGGALLTSVLGEDHPVSRFLGRYGGIIFIVLLLSGLMGILMSPALHVGELWLEALTGWAR